MAHFWLHYTTEFIGVLIRHFDGNLRNLNTPKYIRSEPKVLLDEWLVLGGHRQNVPDISHRIAANAAVGKFRKQVK